MTLYFILHALSLVSVFETGFSERKHAAKRIVAHENIDHYKNSSLAYATLVSKSGQVDIEPEKQAIAEFAYWVKVLNRMVGVAKFLTKRGLAIQGLSSIFEKLTMETLWKFSS